MKKVNFSNVKKHFYIIYKGEYVGQTWAVSAEKARTNFWWKYVKEQDEMSPRWSNPEDYDVVETEG